MLVQWRKMIRAAMGAAKAGMGHRRGRSARLEAAGSQAAWWAAVGKAARRRRYIPAGGKHTNRISVWPARGWQGFGRQAIRSAIATTS